MTQALLPADRRSLVESLTGDAVAARTVVLVGNPNVGKTTLFNALTGQNAQVGNYPGITVERRSTRLKLPCGDCVELVDVPGTYSLCARSPEEQVALQAVLGLSGNPRPSLAIVAIDAGQLARNLYLTLQLVEFQVPALLVLTMMDEVPDPPDPEHVGRLFGLPCVASNGRSGEGVAELQQAIEDALAEVRVGDAPVNYGRPEREAMDRVAVSLPVAWRRSVEHDRALALWALLSLGEDDELHVPETLREACVEALADAGQAGVDLDLAIVQARYDFIESGLTRIRPSESLRPTPPPWTERLDAVLLHPVWGTLAFLGTMLVMFQSLFSWADPLVGLIEDVVGAAQTLARAELPDSLLSSLFIEGVLGGVGNLVVFLPQIMLLFLFIGLLEDSGYMARVAYLVDRVLRSVGLQGKAFVPMLSGLACAVPAIMATRTMERQRDRLLTMLVVPLMSCSARLPVYSLIIGALFPPSESDGWLPIQGLLMIGLYLFSTATTLLAASLLGRTVVRGRHMPLLLELPRYRSPKLSVTARMTWLRAKEFLTEAGTVILAWTIVLWFLLSFPRVASPTVEAPATPAMPDAVAQQVAPKPPTAIETSYGGRVGKALEPIMRPLGFDWKLTVGIIGAFSAREVFVSTLGLVYGLEEADEDSAPLRERLASERRPDGNPAYPPLVGASLLVFFALACQCVSTLAVVKRETRSWRWPMFQLGYMTTLAYSASLLVYQGGQWLGFQG